MHLCMYLKSTAVSLQLGLLLVDRTTGHAGPSTMLADRFCIPVVKGLTKSISHQCVTCRVGVSSQQRKLTTITQPMISCITSYSLHHIHFLLPGYISSWLINHFQSIPNHSFVLLLFLLLFNLAVWLGRSA